MSMRVINQFSVLISFNVIRHKVIRGLYFILIVLHFTILTVILVDVNNILIYWRLIV